MLVDALIYGVALPALVTGLMVLAAGRVWRSAARPEGLAAAVTMAIATGYVAGQVKLWGWARAPVEAWQWLPHIALAAAALVAFGSLKDWMGRVRRGVEAVFVAVVIILMLWPMPLQMWPRQQVWVWVGGLWLAASVGLWSVDGLARRVHGASAAMILLIVGAGAGVLLICSANARLGQLAGVVAATAGAVVVAGWFVPRISLAGGPARLIVLLLYSLLLNAYFNDYTGLPAAAFILMAMAPSCAWLAECPFVKRLGRRPLFLIRATVVLIPVAIAVTLAWRGYSATEGCVY